ncbi:MAG: tRNA pseudouridine(38-40) synthase TruA [Sarcina sp.]
MNYKLIIQFDGSRYYGWQKQTKHSVETIQGKLEGVLSILFKTKIEIIGASRTDSGVHALNYVANYMTDISIDPIYVYNYLNQYLPEDIRVKDVSVVNDRFHSRYNCKNKTYVYKIDNSDFGDVFFRKGSWHVKETLDIVEMKNAANLLVGEHDFKAFTNKSKNKNTIRKIDSIEIEKLENIISISITGNGFLLNMVRIIVGTLKEIASGQQNPNIILEALKYGDRVLTGERAPAKGLYLTNIQY